MQFEACSRYKMELENSVIQLISFKPFTIQETAVKLRKVHLLNYINVYIMFTLCLMTCDSLTAYFDKKEEK